MQKKACAKNIIVLLVGLMTCLPLGAIHAEALVLIQGYKASGNDWHRSGVTQMLESVGWVSGGEMRLDGSSAQAANSQKGNHRYYTVELNSDAPLVYQSRQLAAHLTRIRQQHEGESVTLVGHSAGGVLARLYMVQHPDAGIGTLITLASPHLGTESAEAGLAVGQSPIGWMSRFLGSDILSRSSGLYFDLIREQPGSLLFWLNRQPHPTARYLSVIRDSRLSLFGDMVVPEWSQDMNRVMALRGRAISIPSNANHGLERSDGVLLVQILKRLQGA